MGTTWVFFLTNPGDNFVILGNDKISGAKPLMVDTACSFFGADASESRDDFTISSITTKVGGANILIPRGTF